MHSYGMLNIYQRFIFTEPAFGRTIIPVKKVSIMIFP